MWSLVPRSISNSILFRPVRYIGSIKTEESRKIQNEDVQVVCTSGYTVVGVNGEKVAKYGIYWGINDKRNVLKKLHDGSTYYLAVIQAVVEVLRIASYSELGSKLLIKTDWKVTDDYMTLLHLWNEREYRLYNGAKMKNAELLEEMYHITRDVDVEFEYKPSSEDGKTNYVLQAILNSRRPNNENTRPNNENSRPNNENNRRPSNENNRRPNNENSSVIEVNDGDERDSEGKIPTSPSVGWPVVYVGASYRQRSNGFALASYATHWPADGCNKGVMRRLANSATTLFRGQMFGMENALKEALHRRLPRVVVITDNQKILQFWENKWIRSDGSFILNKDIFDRIKTLISEFEEVRFRFKSNTPNSEEWIPINFKCERGMKFRVPWKMNRILSVENIISRDCNETIGLNLPRARIFKNSITVRRGIVWEEMNEATDNINHELAIKTLQSSLICVLTKAIELNLPSLIVRTDSRRLISACEYWLPMWTRNHWRNSLNKPLADADKWETIWTLKNKIKVYWELMDPFTDEDFKAASLLQPPNSFKIDSTL